MPDVDADGIDERARVVRAPRVIGRRVHGQLVLVRLPSLDTRVLNDVGARVWELAEGRTILEIARLLASELGQPPARILADVTSFVDALLEERLFRIERLPP